MKLKHILIIGILLATAFLAHVVDAQFYNSADVGFSGSTSS